MKKPDIAGGTVGVAFGTWILIEGAKMPPDVVMKIGPNFFPDALAMVLIGFSAILIVKGALSKTDGGFDRIDLRSPGFRRAALALLLSCAYAFILKPVGFIPGTVLFILSLMLLLGSRKARDLTLVPVLATAAVWFVFERLLTISLPVGLLSLFGF